MFGCHEIVSALDLIIKLIKLIFDRIINLLTLLIDNSLFELIINYNNTDLALSLISGEITLISIYFLFFPMIVGNKGKDYYLGYKVSDWILYGNKNKKYSDISKTWIINISIIVISIAFSIFGLTSFVIILFLIFIIILNKKVLLYLNLTSREKLYLEQIEKDFILQVINNKENAVRILLECKDLNKNHLIDNIEVILKNYEKENFDFVFSKIYEDVLKKNDNDSIYILFEKIYEYICVNKEKFSLVIDAWDIYYFLKNNLTEKNENYFYSMFWSIIHNNIRLTYKSIDNYNVMLGTSYKALEDNSNISEKTKLHWKESLIEHLKYLPYNKDHNSNEQNFIAYRYIVDFCKCVIDSKNNDDVAQLVKTFDGAEHDRTLFDCGVTIFIYLYYLAIVETQTYVSQDEKNYYLNIHNKLLKYFNIQEYDIFEKYHNNINLLFDSVEKVSHFWEVFISGEAKTPKSDESILIANRVFIIYSNIYSHNLNNEITDYDIEMFKYSLKDNILNETTKDHLKSFSSFIGLELKDDDISEYLQALINYANKKYRNGISFDINSVEKRNNDFKAREKDLESIIARQPIFNNKACEMPITAKINITTKNEDAISICDYYMSNQHDLIQHLEYKIYHLIAEKMKKIGKELKYQYNNERVILDKIKTLRSKYYYLSPQNDDLEKDYKLGKDYSNEVQKHIKIGTSIYDVRIVIKDYGCKLSNIKIGSRNLTTKELNKIIQEYLCEDNKYCIEHHFGFTFYYTKKEIKEYIKNNYIILEINLNAKLKIIDKKGFIFLRAKRKK